MLFNTFVFRLYFDSMVVEIPTHDPKIKGSNPTHPGSGRGKKSLFFYKSVNIVINRSLSTKLQITPKGNSGLSSVYKTGSVVQ
jgi:hypothetical protein